VFRPEFPRRAHVAPEPDIADGEFAGGVALVLGEWSPSGAAHRARARRRNPSKISQKRQRVASWSDPSCHYLIETVTSFRDSVVSMAKSPKTPRRPLREWIADALRESETLTTSKLHQKVAALSGKTYSATAMYNTVRALAKEKVVSVGRAGHEKVYRLGKSVEREFGKIEKVVERTPAPVPSSAPAPSVPGHKLAMGEVAILHSDGQSVVSATNVHGELILKRHKVPPS
jgi:hypothetical protein